LAHNLFHFQILIHVLILQNHYILYEEEEAKDIKQITDEQIEKLVNKIIEQKLELKQNYIFI